MTARAPFFAILLLILATPAAGELRITTGGERVLERPSFNGDRCSAVLYSPYRLEDPDPVLPGRHEVLYAMGGDFINHCSEPSGSPERFGDRIWYHYRRPDGKWSDRLTSPEASSRPIIDRSSFSWMSDGEYLKDVPEAAVGHVGSPSVLKVDGRYYMAFVATISDPNLCAGEHHAAPTECGRCDAPWSFFVPMWAVSDNGRDWRVAEELRPHRANRALNAALLWTLPTRFDISQRTEFKGVTRVSMVLHEEEGKKYFYIAFGYWGSFRQKAGVVRIEYDPDSETGIGGDPEIWDSFFQRWELCYRGELPGWFNSWTQRGHLFDASFSSIAATSSFGSARYIALMVGTSKAPQGGSSGFGTVIHYALSNDLVRWSSPMEIRSEVPFLADGRGYDLSVIDPVFVDRGENRFSILFASADGMDRADPMRDGRHDCGIEISRDQPTAPYIGTGIYELEGPVHIRQRGIRR